MEQLVRVRQTHEDGTATVLCVRESACSGDCHKCSGCGAAKESILLRADNPLGARIGELVKVESETAPVLKAAAMLLRHICRIEAAEKLEKALDNCTVKITGNPEGATCQQYGDAILALV